MTYSFCNMQLVVFPFLLMSCSPSYRYITFCPSIHWLVDIWIISVDFCFFYLLNNLAVNVLVKVFIWMCFHFSWYIPKGVIVWLCVHLFLTFSETAKLSAKLATIFFIPITSFWELLFESSGVRTCLQPLL